MERLDKLLASRGVGSRQEVRTLCRRRRVSVNGKVITDSSTKVDPAATISVDGELLEQLPRIVLYHKPVGVISTMHDDWERQDLGNVLPDRWRLKLHPVGRLDADTSGLLLFSSDGQITQRLLHPRRGVEREYLATVEGSPQLESLGAVLAEGVETAEGIVQSRLEWVEGDRVRVVVTEGKHRMVRRMLNNAGFPVLELHRLRYGGFELGDLEVGEFLVATDEQLEWLGMPE